MLDLLESQIPPTMKAVSLWQPWASLIARGVKRHETRDWLTKHRGHIAICASKTIDRAGAPEALCLSALGADWAHDCPRGAVVAIGYVTACLPAATIDQDITAADHVAGNFANGRWAWRIDHVRPLRKPVPVIGRQGLYNWTAPPNLGELLSPVLDHEELCHRIGWGRRQAEAVA